MTDEPFCIIGGDRGIEHKNRAMQIIGGIRGLISNAKTLERFFLAAPEINSVDSKFKNRYGITGLAPSDFKCK